MGPQGQAPRLAFSNYLHPEPIKAAVEVLEHSGYRVMVPEQHLCCGRPLYDYGMLDTARLLWKRMLEALRPEIRAGTPLVGIEPSCVAAFRDELPNLLADDEDARRLSEQSLTLAELLTERTGGWRPPPLRREAIVHGHCHQAAIMGIGADRELLEAMGLDVEVLDSGCCGVAGSFGFERDHHEISVAIGERRLLPAVRNAPDDAILVADGFSCKTQISELTDRRALHLAQVIRMAIDHGPDGPPGPRPERGYPDVEPARPGMREALAGAGVAAASGLAATAALRRGR